MKNEESMNLIMKQFHPLINKYAKLLMYKFGYEYDDAYSDMVYEFIKMIYVIPLSKFDHDTDVFLLTYIKKSVVHSYLYYGEKVIGESNCNLQKIHEYNDIPCNGISDLILIQDMKAILTSQEFAIIYLYIYDDISIADIANRLKISRQYVNKIKNIAYKKMIEYLKGGEIECQ